MPPEMVSAFLSTSRLAMSSSRFFWKLVLICAGLNSLAAVAVGILLIRWLQGGGADPPRCGAGYGVWSPCNRSVCSGFHAG